MASKAAAPVTEMTRKVVVAGMDFSPVLLDLGDGEVWSLDPDPSPAKFGNLQKALSAFGAIARAAETGDEIDLENISQNLSNALAALLTDAAQKKTWKSKAYGIMAMQRLAATYIPEISGTPTK